MNGLLFLYIGWSPGGGKDKRDFKRLVQDKKTLSQVSMYDFESYLIDSGKVSPELMLQFKKQIKLRANSGVFKSWAEERYSKKVFREIKKRQTGKILELTSYYNNYNALRKGLVHYDTDPVTTIEELNGLMKNMMFIWMSEVFFLKRLLFGIIHDAYYFKDPDVSLDNYPEQAQESVNFIVHEWISFVRMRLKFKKTKHNGSYLIHIPKSHDYNFDVNAWNRCLQVLFRISNFTEAD